MADFVREARLGKAGTPGAVADRPVSSPDEAAHLALAPLSGTVTAAGRVTG
ncbi:hypothetical protein [Streptomyces sp. NPDC047079]|uniref:hypothetical protein n=1 Tax=Streptomyces sp. NPDC047079 TaxID=3154607 RepID=UPI0034005702